MTQAITSASLDLLVLAGGQGDQGQESNPQHSSVGAGASSSASLSLGKRFPGCGNMRFPSYPKGPPVFDALGIQSQPWGCRQHGRAPWPPGKQAQEQNHPDCFPIREDVHQLTARQDCHKTQILLGAAIRAGWAPTACLLGLQQNPRAPR